MNKYNVRFYAYAEESEYVGKGKNNRNGYNDYFTTLDEAYLDFEFDCLDEAMGFIKIAEKHIVKKPTWAGSQGSQYCEVDDWDCVWEISLNVKNND